MSLTDIFEDHHPAFSDFLQLCMFLSLYLKRQWLEALETVIIKCIQTFFDRHFPFRKIPIEYLDLHSLEEEKMQKTSSSQPPFQFFRCVLTGG